MVNGFAGFHDVIQAKLTDITRNIVNLPAIVPAVAITTLGAIAPITPTLIQTDVNY